MAKNKTSTNNVNQRVNIELMLDKLKKIYHSIPSEYLGFLKYTPNEVLFGKEYGNTKKNISFEKITHNQKLYDLLLYNQKHTQFGKENIKGSIHPDEVFELIKEIPKVTADQIAENLDYYKSDQFNSINSYETTTGGTGRRPTTIVLSNKSFGIEWAHMHHIWEHADYKRTKQIKLTLRGTSLPNDKLFDFNPIYNEIIVNSFTLNKNNFPLLMKKLLGYKIQFIHGYPSLISEFKDYLIYHGLNFNVKAIFLGSEGASVELKNGLKSFFNAKIISWYGQSEKVILAVDANACDKFKVYSSYGYSYIANADSNGFGEIIGCSYINRALPLINYQTGDYGTIITDEKHLYIEDLQGRWGKDFVYLTKEKKIPTSSINIHGKIQKYILFYQIIQSEYGILNIRILPIANSPHSPSETISELKKELHSKLSGFNVNYEIVYDESKIIRSKRGKMIFLLQNIKTNNQ